VKTRTVQLGEVCEFVYGESLKAENRRSGKVPVYGSNGLVGVHDNAITRGPTIVIGRKGSIGEVNWSSEPCFPIDTTYYVEKTKKVCDLRWLYFILLKLDLTRLNKSAAIPGLNRDDAYEQLIPFPDLPEQRRIAGRLEQADRLRRTRRYALELSDTFLPAAFLELFGDPVSNPKRWEKKPLGEICAIRRGASPRPIDNFLGGSVPWIKIGDGTKGDRIYITSTEDHVTAEGASKSVFLKSGSLIFANCGVSCGFARLLKIDGCIHDGWLAFQGFEKALDPIFFLQAINQITLHLRRLAPEGTQPNLNTGIMSDFAMVVPPLPLQQKFAALVDRVERLRAAQRESLRQAEHLFATKPSAADRAPGRRLSRARRLFPASFDKLLLD
jgi:type I restriction enzyme S subunit